jgi:hypothetical protein
MKAWLENLKKGNHSQISREDGNMILKRIWDVKSSDGSYEYVNEALGPLESRVIICLITDSSFFQLPNNIYSESTDTFERNLNSNLWLLTYNLMDQESVIWWSFLASTLTAALILQVKNIGRYANEARISYSIH